MTTVLKHFQEIIVVLRHKNKFAVYRTKTITITKIKIMLQYYYNTFVSALGI